MVPEVLSHYRIIKNIGKGGTCEVYLAEDTVLKRKVALKILVKESLSSGDAQKRFLKEAEATARLDHPNICSIYEVGSDQDLSFIAIQYIEGETLATWMYAHQLNLEEITNIAAQVADALAEAHSKGIIHRDIKPQNIMITPRGLAKVLDFGLAKVTQESCLAASQDQTEQILTRPGFLVGTLPYFSPEQARGEVIDLRSDIFSLGVVMYELLSGKHPFRALSEAVTLSLILTHEPPPLTELLPEIPDELQRIVSKALCKDMELRYQTARELHIDLMRLKAKLTSEDRKIASRPFPDGSADTIAFGRSTPGNGMRLTAKAQKKTDTKPATSGLRRVSRSRILKPILIGILFVSLIIAAGLRYFPTGESGDSVAILPFIFMGADESKSAVDNEYLSDGLTENVINSLSQLPGLKVTARASVFRYKGKDLDLKQVAHDLGVRTIFIGRIIQRGENITIKAELSDARDNRQIWGTQYNRKASDLLVLEKEIARDIIENLGLKLTGNEQTRLNKSYTENAEAYDLYLKGRYYWNKRTEDGFRKAVEFFQQAIQKDSSYALAYSGLADSYMLLSDWGFMRPVEGYPQARDAVVRALSIDDQLAEAHTSLAGIKAVLDWDWAGAETEYKKAISLNPNYATAHHWYGTHLMTMGRADESLVEIKEAQRLDPLSLGINKDLAAALLYARRYDESLEQCQKTLEIDPSFLTMYPAMAQAYQGKQMYAEAVDILQKAHGMLPDDPEITYALAEALAFAGRKSEAKQILDDIERLSSQRQLLPKDMALLNALLGEKDKAFEILEKAYEEHYFVVSELKVDTRFDMLRSDSRYVDLLRRIGLQ